jgi:polyferredoxin
VKIKDDFISFITKIFLFITSSQLYIKIKKNILGDLMKKIKPRNIIQILFFLTVLIITLAKNAEELGITFLSSIEGVSLHSICPFGAVETFYTLITGQGLIPKIHPSSLVLFVILVISAVFFGGAFCGFICPLGSIQELVGKFGKKLFPKKYNKLVPYKVDKYLKYLRYVVLAIIVYFSGYSLSLVFADYDPYFALFNFYTEEVALTAILVLVIVLVSSLFIERPWCKYLCPLSAILGIFNKFRIFKIVRNKTTCINCRKCDNVCPMNIKVSEKEIINDTNCISCLKCTSDEICPIDNTLDMKIGGLK